MVDNIPVTNDERPYVQVSTECEARNNLTICNPVEDRVKMKDTSATTIQLREHQTAKGEIPTLKELSVS